MTLRGGTPALQVLVPPKGWRGLDIREIWQSREVLFFMAHRDIKVRYTQAAFGIAWAVLQPTLMMLVFSLFFGRLAKLPSDGLPYPIFALSGLVPWTYFANSVAESSLSVVSSSNLISKVYFPRILVPLAALVSWIPDFLLASVVLLAMMAAYGVSISWTIVFVPLFVVLAFIVAASVSVWLSALNVAYRDVRFALPFILQLWLFTTPVIYPASLVPGKWRWLLGLNPEAGVVEGFRWALVGGNAPWTLIVCSFVIAAVSLSVGAFYFRRVESFFADII